MALFRRNPRFESQMKRDPRYQASIRARVEAVVVPRVKARADAAGEPYMPRGGRGVEVEQSADAVQVVNTDHGAWIAEVGSPSRNTPAHAPLRGGVHDAGLRLREE
jgi:hypothetical protein